MKNKTIAILLLATTISISGCGGCSKNEASTEPTEVVMETESIIETEEPTETEEIAVETETPPTDYNALYPGFSSENITFNAGGVVIDYNEKFIAECKKYDTFRECSDDEIKEILKTVIESSMGKIERTPEEYHKTLSELDKNGVNAKDLLQLNEEASSSSSSQTSKPSGSNSNSNNNTNSNKGNSSSTSNNSSNQTGSTSNTTNETANTNEDNWTPPAKSSNNAEDGFAGVIDNGDGTITSSDGTFTMSDGSNFGGDVSDPNNYTHYGNKLH